MAVSKEQYKKASERAMEYYNKASIVITDKEKESIKVADFGLGNLYKIGIEVITYVNAERSCAKEVVLFPDPICPEHRHPPIDAKNPGKEETFRLRNWKSCQSPQVRGVPTQHWMNPAKIYCLAAMVYWYFLILWVRGVLYGIQMQGEPSSGLLYTIQRLMYIMLFWSL